MEQSKHFTENDLILIQNKLPSYYEGSLLMSENQTYETFLFLNN